MFEAPRGKKAGLEDGLRATPQGPSRYTVSTMSAACSLARRPTRHPWACFVLSVGPHAI